MYKWLVRCPRHSRIAVVAPNVARALPLSLLPCLAPMAGCTMPRLNGMQAAGNHFTMLSKHAEELAAQVQGFFSTLARTESEGGGGFTRVLE